MKRTSVDLTGVLANAAEAFFVLDETGKVVMANAALGRLLGMESVDPRAIELGLVKPAEDLVPGPPRRVERVFDHGRKRQWLHLVFLPLTGDDGRLVGTLAHASAGKAPDIPKSPESLSAERIERQRDEQRARFGFETLPARSSEMLRVLEQVKIATGGRRPVTLVGEAGVGKRTLARLIHDSGPAPRGSFLTLDCHSLTAELQREQLVGRPAGFDLAGQPGLLDVSTGGTLCILEPSRLTHELQRELVTRTSRQGFQWRLVMTARVSLEHSLADGSLDESFYYLISIQTIAVPPLRRQTAEIADYCDRILASYNSDSGKPPITLEPQAMAVLAKHDWPGNLRSLESVLIQIAEKSQATTIAKGDLPRRLRKSGDEDDVGSELAVRPPPPLDLLLEQVERRMMTLALARHKGNKSKAAEFLGISRARLHRRAAQLGLDGFANGGESDFSVDSVAEGEGP